MSNQFNYEDLQELEDLGINNQGIMDISDNDAESVRGGVIGALIGAGVGTMVAGPVGTVVGGVVGHKVQKHMKNRPCGPVEAN